MSSTVTFVISVLSVMHGIQAIHARTNGNFWTRYIDPTAAVLSITPQIMETCNQRQAPGLICMDCSNLARCVYRNNGWDTIPLEFCDSGQNLFCHEQEQRCSTSPGPCNQDGAPGAGSFSCTAAGIFPSPFNCQGYHVCFVSGNDLVSVNIQCGGNAAFNPVMNDCSLSLNNPICMGSQFTCNNVGDMGPWPLNANIYYMCLAGTDANGQRFLFPSIFRCQVGLIFRNGDCVPPNGVDGNVFDCTVSGLFPDLADCHAYFHCDALLRSQRIVCPTGTYFNRITNGCIRGTC